MLPDGRVLVGGHADAAAHPPFSRTAIYAPSTNRWAAAGFGSGTGRRTWTLLADGNARLIGSDVLVYRQASIK